MKHIEKLYLHLLWVDWISVSNLKELRLNCDRTRFNINIYESGIVKSYPDLERVSLKTARVDDILQFVRGSPKLNKLRIEYFHPLAEEEESAIDLSAWNCQRATLARAQEVTIYVEEDVFLAIKWAKHKTDYSLIRLKRLQSVDWGNDFGYM